MAEFTHAVNGVPLLLVLLRETWGLCGWCDLNWIVSEWLTF